MASLGNLTLDLVARVGGFTGALDKAGRDSNKFSKSVTDGFQKMGAAVGVAAVAAAGSIAYFVKQSIDMAEEANKMAQATGLTVEAFTGLAYAAKLSELDIEQFKGGMTKLNKTLAEAGVGGKEQASIFKALGISVKDASGNLRAGDDVLKDIAEKFAAMPDGVDKSATALKIFGKAGADMIPFLNEGKDGITAMVKEAEALGLVLSTTQAQAADQFNDSLTTLGQVSRGAANNVAGALLPALNSLTGMMIDVAKDTGTASEFGNILAGVLKFVASTAITGATAIMNIGRVIGGVAAAASLAAQGEFKLAAATLAQITADNKAATAVADERVKKLMNTDYEAIGKKAAKVSDILGKAASIAAGDTAKHTKVIKDQTNAIDEQIKSLQHQYEIIGMTETESKLWDMDQKGATGTQLKQAEAILKKIDALKAEKTAQDEVAEQQKADQAEIEQNLEDYQALIRDLMTDEEKYKELIQERLDIMARVGGMPDSEMTARIVGADVTKAPTFGGGTPKDGFSEIDSADAELEAWYEKEIERQELAQELALFNVELFEETEDKKQEIYEEYSAKKDEIDKARLKTQSDLNMAAAQGEIAIFESLAESMSGITKNFAGESSTAYKAMFAIQKIFAAAAIIVNTEIAASKAAATAGNVFSGQVMAAMIRVAGYAQAGMVAGMALAGMAHDGIDSVPQDGTWMLKKGERVSTSETSAKLDKTLDSVAKQTSGGDAPIVNLYEDKNKAGQVESRQQDGQRVIDIWISDIMGDGRTQKAMSRKFGLQTVGV